MKGAWFVIVCIYDFLTLFSLSSFAFRFSSMGGKSLFQTKGVACLLFRRGGLCVEHERRQCIHKEPCFFVRTSPRTVAGDQWFVSCRLKLHDSRSWIRLRTLWWLSCFPEWGVARGLPAVVPSKLSRSFVQPLWLKFELRWTEHESEPVRAIFTVTRTLASNDAIPELDLHQGPSHSPLPFQDSSFVRTQDHRTPGSQASRFH